MSDPVTNVDVEDVLSSIRRLVSDTNSDGRPSTKGPEAAEPPVFQATEEPDAPSAEAPEVEKQPDALILTSALRVNTQEPESVPEFRHTEMSNFRQTLLEDTPSEDEGDAAEHADWPSMANDEYYEDDEQPESAPVIDFIRHGRNTTPTEVAPEPAEDFGEAAFSEDAPSDSAKDVEEEAAESSEDFDPAHAWVDEPEFATSVETEEAEEASSEIDDVEADAKLAAIVEELPQEETLEAETVFASAAAASVMEEPEAPDEVDVDLADLEESIIDEDALRDLVAEIVRQELTGDLGERITRNVRKLVRREIHRALLTREFE